MSLPIEQSKSLKPSLSLLDLSFKHRPVKGHDMIYLYLDEQELPRKSRRKYPDCFVIAGLAIEDKNVPLACTLLNIVKEEFEIPPILPVTWSMGSRVRKFYKEHQAGDLFDKILKRQEELRKWVLTAVGEIPDVQLFAAATKLALEKGRKTKQIILSVKAGKTTVSQLRDLRGVIDRENAEIGVLISMQEPTRNMKTEAAGAGFYESPWGTKHPRLQLLTVSELLAGKGIDYPPTRGNVTFKKAKRISVEDAELLQLEESPPEEDTDEG